MKALAFVLVLLAAGNAHAQDVPGGLIGFNDNAILVGGDTVQVAGVWAAAYDPQKDLVWFVSEDELRVLDLRAGNLTPIVIAKNWPMDIRPFAVTGASTAEYTNDRGGIRYPVLAWGKTPKIKTNAKARFLTSKGADKAAKKAIKKIKLVGKKWLKKHRTRKARKTPLAGVTKKDKVTLKDLDRCTVTKLCGEAYSLTPDYQLVVAYNDDEPVGCVLHDPATGLFVDPTPPAIVPWDTEAGDHLKKGPCYGYGVSTDGKSYVVDGYVCSVDKQGVGCQQDQSWTYLGWTAPAAM